MIGKFKILCIGLMIVMSGFGGLFLMSQTASAFTIVTGDVSGVWDATGSPYYVNDHTNVQAIDKLVIDASAGPVEIFFNGTYSFSVYGELYVNGTDANKVTFTSGQLVPAKADWNGLYLYADATMELHYTEIFYPTLGVNAASAPAYLSVYNSNISHIGQTGINMQNVDDGIVKDTAIFDCDSKGIALQTGNENWLVENCNISNTVSQALHAETGSHGTTVLNTTSYNTGQSHFQFDSSDNTTIDNCTLVDGNDGITFLICNWANVTNSNISNQARYGIRIEESWGCSLSDSDVTNCLEGIDAWKTYHTNSDNNTFIGNSDIAMWFGGGGAGGNHNLTLIDNLLLDNPNDGITFGGITEDVIVWGNEINNSTGPGNAGLNIEGTIQRATVTDNTFIGNEGEGMSIGGGSGTIQFINVTDNTFIDNQGYGIYLTNGIGTVSETYIYHNNFINNTVHAFDDTGVNYWNTTYNLSPLRGGNYWDNYSGLDNFNGANQDIAGGDGIGDTNYTWIEGGMFTNDTYPFIEAFTNTPPESDIDPVIEYWHNSNVAVTASATDMDNGVENVTLWYIYSVDNAIWDSWTSFETVETSPWSWNFDFPDGEGYYELYSIANDTVGNMEAPPSGADSDCGYDATAPVSSTDVITPYLQNQSLTINATANDALSGLDNVTLYYRFSDDNTTWDSWTFFEADMVAPYSWSFDFPDVVGYYEFYTLATDIAGNLETAPGSADTECQYDGPSLIDTTEPISSVDDITWDWITELVFPINATASDVDSDILNVTLYYRYSSDNTSGGLWILVDADSTEPYSWSFPFEDGPGYYEFMSIAIDTALNEETMSTDADAMCKYDDIAPLSAIVLPDNYWSGGGASLSLDIIASDIGSGVLSVTSWYNYSQDNSTWDGWTQMPGNNFPEGEGYYQFYTTSVDNAGNVEDAPVTPDILKAYDSTAPIISNDGSFNGTDAEFSVAVTDNMELDQVRLIYRFGDGNEKNVTMGLDSGNYTYSISLPDGNYTLYFEFAAVDAAGNWNTIAEKSVEIADGGVTDDPDDPDDPDDLDDDDSGIPTWLWLVLILVGAMVLILLLAKRKKPEEEVEETKEEPVSDETVTESENSAPEVEESEEIPPAPEEA